MSGITQKQLTALQVLYARTPRSAGSDGDPRAERLAWASGILGREITSFRYLLAREAEELIDSLKRELGQAISPKPERRRREKSAQAQNVLTLATAEDFRAVDLWRDHYGWSAEQLDGWLASPHSPTRGRKLLTRSACRAVVTALRVMVRRRNTSKPAA